MPIKRSAYKELRKAKVRHVKNIAIKSELKTLAKRLEKLISEKKAAEANSFFNTLISKVDRAVSKGIVHKNAASRKASRLMKKIASLSKT